VFSFYWLIFILRAHRNKEQWSSPLFEIALVLVRFDHIASRNVNADHGIGGSAVAVGNFCKAKDKESGAGQRSSHYQNHQGGTYAIPDSTCSRIDDSPLRADHRGLFMLRWAAAASDVDFVTKKLPPRTIVKNFEAKHARQEKENQKTNQSPRPQTPQRGQRGYAPKSSPWR
jgi:hypothetical protein